MFFFTDSKTKFQQLYKKFNGAKMHPYKINLMTFKSKDILKKIKYANSLEVLTQLQELLYNENFLSKVHEKWNPTCVFVTLGEIHLLKKYEEDDDYTLLYNGNIHKVLTSLTSIVSLSTGFEFSGSFIEFDNDSDIVDFIEIKQRELYRNVLNFYWANKDTGNEIGFPPPMKDIEDNLDLKIPDNLKYGVFVKRNRDYVETFGICRPDDKGTDSNWSVFGKVVTQTKYTTFTGGTFTGSLDL
jgi:hypothetical protein